MYMRRDTPIFPVLGGWRDQAHSFMTVLPKLLRLAKHFEKKADA